MLLGLMLVLVVLILLFRTSSSPSPSCSRCRSPSAAWRSALILTQNALSMPVLIGILMLMGIVTKNAILLVDFAIEMMQPRHDAARRPSSKPAASAPGRSS